MTFILMAQTIAKYDAIGNDIKHMYEALCKKGDTYVYGDFIFIDGVNVLSQVDLEALLGKHDTVLVYHHSILWEQGEYFLSLCQGKKILCYHNITPPEYYEPYTNAYTHVCREGRLQTERLIKNHPDAFWISDSSYNDSELAGALSDHRFVRAPFNNIRMWDKIKPDEALLSSLVDSPNINLLFVGRIVPNKGYDLLLDILKTYVHNYDKDIKLNLIGKKDGALQGYYDHLDDKIEQYHLGKNINFVGEINDSILISYYLGCDFFICASDHEGFGVPLLEAQYLHLPVIAKDTSAVGETLGPMQMRLGTKATTYAAAIKTLYDDPTQMAFLRRIGYENYKNRFENEVVFSKFDEIIDKVCGVK